MKKPEFDYHKVQKFSSIKEMVDLAREQAGDKAAYMFKENKEERTVTFREFADTTDYLGAALYELGVGDKHIANIGENSYKWIVIYLTVLKSEGVYVPIDKELPFENIVNIVNTSDSEVMFYSKKFENKIKENRDLFPNVKYFIGHQREEHDGEFLSFDLLVKRGKELSDSGYTLYRDAESDKNALKMLVFTSGTTGTAKGVMLSEHNLVSSIYYGLEVSHIYTRALSVLPYHHTYEAVCGILVAIHYHATLCINDKLTNVLKNLQYYKPDYIYLVPAFAELFYKRIHQSLKEKKVDKLIYTMIKISNFLLKLGIDVRRKFFKSIIDNFGGNLKEIICGGAPVRAEIGEFFDSIGIYLINGYGITECSPLVAVNREEFNDCTTVGRLLRCLELRFDDIDSDGVGEITVKGDVVMMGYYKKPAETKEVLSEDGWFKTGDFGKLDEKGFLVITGRKKNIIVLSNGKNIFPEEIEAYIQGIDYVKEVVVYSFLDETGQEAGLTAEVFPDYELDIVKNCENLEEMLKKDISDVTNELPVYKKIGRIKIRDVEFVKNTSNKIRRNLINKD